MQNTMDKWAPIIGGISLIYAFIQILWTYQKDNKTESTMLAFAIPLILTFFTLLGNAKAQRTANILGCEQLRPYLCVQVDNETVIIKNIGKGIALNVLLYTSGSHKEVDKLGIIAPGEKVILSTDTGKLIKDQGIEVFCECQQTRWWNASIGPMASKFSTEYVELTAPLERAR